MELEALITQVTKCVLEELKKGEAMVPVGISARHVHLTEEDLKTLFGQEHALTFLKALSQPGQFAAEEVVELVGPKGAIQKVRILGPTRQATQVEIAMSDARRLGIKPMVRGSGDLDGTPGVLLKGPQGQIQIQQGVIVAERHLHASIQEASERGLVDGEMIRIKVEGKKGGVLEQVVVRVHKDYALDLHIDTDDANAFGINQGEHLKFEKI